jgi:hypothetical protein
MPQGQATGPRMSDPPETLLVPSAPSAGGDPGRRRPLWPREVDATSEPEAPLEATTR